MQSKASILTAKDALLAVSDRANGASLRGFDIPPSGIRLAEFVLERNEAEGATLEHGVHDSHSSHSSHHSHSSHCSSR
jgi:hypothetical protein